MSVLTALAMRIPGLSQIQILDKFIRGLKPKTKIEVELRGPKTPDEAYRLADRFHRIVYGTRNISFLTQNYNRYAPTLGASSNTDYGELQIDNLRLGLWQSGVNLRRSRAIYLWKPRGLHGKNGRFKLQ